MTTGETCRTCNRVHGVDGYNPRHPFNGLHPSEPAEVRPVPKRWPFDPVLRQALIDKGVLTPDDLRNAEIKITVVTGVFDQAVREATIDDA